MNTAFTSLIVLACLIVAVLIGRILRRVLPEAHLSAESRDAVKLAMGLVATMSALILGLLVSSAKGSYDTERSEVIQMAAKVAFLNRVLLAYGPEAFEARARIRDSVEEGIRQIWPGEMQRSASYTPNIQIGNIAYSAIQRLAPSDNTQRSLKAQAASVLTDLGEVRSLLAAQSVPSISIPMLIILVFWLAIIFVGFSVLAPPNATAILALMFSALAVSGAIFLIMELDQPFDGLIRISSQPMLNALHQLAK